MIIVDLTFRLSLLVAISVLSGFIVVRFERTKLSGKILQGLLFGIAAVIGMHDPFILSKGIIFDGRSILISLCTLFFGPLSGIIAAVMALIYRLIIGGAGLIMGILVIMCSFIIGYIFHIRRASKPDLKLSAFKLYQFGLLVHAAMLLLILTIPLANIASVYKSISLTVIGIYPFVTLLIGKILLDQEENQSFIKKLEESEERLRLSLKAANQGLYDLNVQTGSTVVSEEYATMLGYDPKTFVETNSSWIERLHPDDKPAAAKAYLDYVEGRTQEYRIEFRQRTRDGSWKWILSTGKIVEYDSEGKPLRMLGTHTDITELKQTVIALQKSEEKFAKMFRSSPDTITLSYLKNGLIVDVNEACLEKTGYVRDEIIGKTVVDLNLWADINDRDKYVAELLNTGKITNFETRFRMKSGELRDALISGEVIELDGEKFILGIIRDITERKESEKSLFENQMRLQSIVSNAPVILFGLDADGVFTFSEGKGLQALGLKPGEVVGQSALEIYKDFPDVVKSMKRALNGEVLSAIHDMGKWVFDVYYTPLKSENGQINAVIGVATDITERTKVENALRQSEEKFRTIFNSTPVPLAVNDSEQNILLLNDEFVKIFGYTLEDIPTLNEWWPRAYPDAEYRQWVTSTWQDHLNESKESNEPFEPLELKIKCKDGTYRTAIAGLSWLGDPKSSIQLVILYDITERERAEKEIQNKNKDLAKLFEISINLLESADKKTILEKIVENSVDLIGLDSGAIYLIDDNELILQATTPALPDYFPDEFRKADLSNHTHILNAIKQLAPVIVSDVSEAELSAEEKIITQSRNLGSLVYLPLLVGKQAAGVLILGTIGRKHDFTENEIGLSKTLSNLASLSLENSVLFEKLNKNIADLRKAIDEKNVAGEALKESEERFHAMFEKHHAIMLLVEPESGNIIDANQSAEKFYGYNLSQLQLMNIGQINMLPPEQLHKEIQKAATESRTSFNFSHKLSSGEIRSVEVFSTPITVANKILLFSIIHDITERELAEMEVLSSQLQLRALAARIESVREEERIHLSRELHDNLGQSLTGLKMDVAWLGRKISKKKPESVETILDKTKSMSELIDVVINDVRRLSLDLRPNLLDHLGLLSALNWLVDDFKKRSEKKCVFISNIKDIEVNQTTATSVFRIFQEAFTNISRHSDSTLIQFSIDASKTDYIFTLNDNGEGISEDEIKRVSSLGVRGMKERSIQINATLTIKGSKNKGTTITLTVPKDKI